LSKPNQLLYHTINQPQTNRKPNQTKQATNQPTKAMSKSFLLCVLAVAISSRFVAVESRLDIQLDTVFERDDEATASRETDSDASETSDRTQFGATARIVGGTEAAPFQYPYFGKFSKCARSSHHRAVSL
jgi:hypothetical protein